MRQHSLKTTYLIHETLVKDENITSLINEKNIYLLIAEQEVTFPYCIIRRTGCKSENGNRDFAGDIVSFNIKIYSNKYAAFIKNLFIGLDFTVSTKKFSAPRYILIFSAISSTEWLTSPCVLMIKSE